MANYTLKLLQHLLQSFKSMFDHFRTLQIKVITLKSNLYFDQAELLSIKMLFVREYMQIHLPL